MLTPGFIVLHGNRLEDLRNELIGLLKNQPLPPLTPEVILVQSNGMKHWLEMALASDSDGLGICAATRLELPSSYLWQLYRSVLGADTVPAHMPFDKSRLLWRLVRLLPELAARNPVYAPLARYLDGHQAGGRKLYQLAMQVADVFDGYQSYRADWLSDWATGPTVAGHDLLRTSTTTSNTPGRASPALPAAHAWQAQLWRDIRTDVGAELAEASRASVHARFMAALRALRPSAPQRPTGLPPRLVVFGISSLPMQTVEALAELGQVCQVVMLVQNPCQHYWGDIVEGHDQLRQQVRRRQAIKPTTAHHHHHHHEATHPLLASWGKQGRDYLHLLDEFDRVELYQQRFARVDVFADPAAAHADGAAQPSQLNLLQSAILNLQPLPDQPVALPRAGDSSITFVTTHSAQREVEVLHDQLLAWFDADPALNPRDVMIMVPDMSVFAPHIRAVFGRFAPGQPRHIPYSVADSTPRQVPLVQALEQLLSLPTSRVSLADWLALFEVAAVRTRFGVSEADVAQLHSWLSLAGVRWGLDATHRTTWGVPAGVDGLDQNTWDFGLRRLLLGYAVGAGEPWGATLPQAALGGLDARLVGALLEWMQAMQQTLEALSSKQSPEQWGATLEGLVSRFFKASDDAEDRLIQRCLAPLEQWLQACADAALATPLPLEVVREHWLSQLEEPGLHQRFFGGGVQFGTLMPMRSIPFKAVGLLGMNDGDYPRQKAPRDFDLMTQSWRAGDRSRREDDRYLFLEALLSARDKLYISWQGHHATDNSEQPPSVLVAQLLDYLQAAWAPPPQPQQQPLQPFSDAYFLHTSPFETYDADWARVHHPPEAQAPDQPTSPPTPAPTAPTQLTMADLHQLVRQPVEVFFKSRLRVRLDSVDEMDPLEEPFALNGLEQYQAGQQLLAANATPQAMERLTLSGQLPMAAFGARMAGELHIKAQAVLERQAPWAQRYPHTLPAQSIALTVDGVAITGTLEGLRSGHDGRGGEERPPPDNEGASWLQLSQRTGAVLEGDADAPAARGHIICRLWVNHVLGCASGMPLTSVQLGLDGEVALRPLPQPEAQAIVRRLLAVYRAAWERPLPVACKTGWAYVRAQLSQQHAAAHDAGKEPKDPHEAAQAIFDGGHHRPGEHAESAYLARAFETYEDIESELPQWAELLYGELFEHTRPTQPSHLAESAAA